MSGCAAEPVPDPTPTPTFASEAEAFAAAEATYRAYVDALNQVDLADPETFEAVYAWTTGDANAEERENLTRMHADKWQVTGQTAILAVLQNGTTLNSVLACVDVSSVDVVDASGESQVSPDRPDRYALIITLAAGTSASGYVISSSEAVEASRCG